MYKTIWEFKISPKNKGEFEAAYGANGAWAQFFRRSVGYLGTELVAVSGTDTVYRTTDSWKRFGDFKAFKEKWHAEYEALDKTCEKLTEQEKQVASFTLLYRGHKDADFRKTKYKGLCFAESMDLAIGYGLGNNDAGNASVTDGFVSTVEFHGEIEDGIPFIGLDFVQKHIDGFRKHDAVRCRDGVIVVLNQAKLRNPQKVKATQATG